MVIVAVGSLDEYRGGEEPVVYIYQLDVELRDVRSVIAVVDKARGEKKRPVLSRFLNHLFSCGSGSHGHAFTAFNRLQGQVIGSEFLQVVQFCFILILVNFFFGNKRFE